MLGEFSSNRNQNVNQVLDSTNGSGTENKTSSSGLEKGKVSGSVTELENTEINSDCITRIQLLQKSICNMHKAIRQSGKPNYVGCRIPLQTNINIGYLEKELTEYHDREVV